MVDLPNVILSDDSIIALGKPAEMSAVLLSEGESGTVASWLLEKFPEQIEIENGPLEAGLVHRLDNDTSGLMLAARTQSIYEKLRKEISDGSIEKIYLALVLGIPPDSGIIEKDIAHHPRKKKKMVVCDTLDISKKYKGRNAKTEFSVIERFKLRSISYALLEVTIKTGVRHQIRTHLASKGFPISGDKLYQNAKKRVEEIL